MGDFRGFTEESIRRYGRQIILPEIGGKGQRKLLESRVLLIGAGGLGAPNALYLAAAGIGTIGIIDDDKVEMSNLHRQVVHSTKDLGRPKVESAMETMKSINPDIEVIAFKERITSKNAMEIIRDFDLVVDGCDSFATRYLVNDACVLLGKPNVYGSVFRFEGQASLFVPGEGPCYRCLFPEPPPAGMVPSCQEAGVLGVLPGVIGLIQSTEALKYLLGIGESLRDRLLLFDALRMEFRYMKTRRDPACPVCGDNPTITELIDYEESCNVHF
ncbi:MAG: molybdopterin-synthase adenylyltransferase MoeB [bacterium]